MEKTNRSRLWMRILICFGILLLVGGMGMALHSEFPALKESLLPQIYGREGRDAMEVLGNGKFQIETYGKNRCFVVFTGPAQEDVLFNEITVYKKYEHVLYVVSRYGYAVAYGDTNTCKLYLRVYEEELLRSLYARGDDSLPKNVITEDPSVTYLSSFEDFTEEEQDALRALIM